MMVSRLEYIFENVNNWLQFGEAKNAVLIGYLVALISVLDFDDLSAAPSIKIVSLVLLVISFFFPMISFFPLYGFSRLKKNGNNLMFYRDIAGYSSRDYVKAVRRKYFSDHCNEDNSDKQIVADLAKEIVANSRITVYKMTMFKLGLLSSGLLTIWCVVWWVL